MRSTRRQDGETKPPRFNHAEMEHTLAALAMRIVNQLSLLCFELLVRFAFVTAWHGNGLSGWESSQAVEFRACPPLAELRSTSPILPLP